MGVGLGNISVCIQLLFKIWVNSAPLLRRVNGSLVKVSSAVRFPVKCHAGQDLVVDVYVVAVKGLGEIAKHLSHLESCIIRLHDHEW